MTRSVAEMSPADEAAPAEWRSAYELLQATMDASDDMIQVFEAVRDDAGQISDFRWILNNHASERRYGEVRGESLLQRNPGVIPTGIFDSFKRVTETGVPEQAEHHYVHEQFDGWFYQSVVKLGDGVATTSKDISAWKAAQDKILLLQAQLARHQLREQRGRFAAIFDQAPVGLSVIAPDGRFEHVNDELCRILCRPRDALLALGVVDVTHPDDVPKSRTALREAARVASPVTLDKRYLRPDGSFAWANSTVSALPGHGEGPAGFLVVTADLTERRRAEAAVRESETLQRLLIGELQHRTFNLMGVVRATADLTIASSVDLADFRAKFNSRIDALARVQRLLSRLQDHDRVTFGELVRAELDATGALDGDRTRVTLDGPADVPLRSGTVQTFAMALHELATNAVKYGALGQPDARLRVSWSVRQAAPGAAWLHVDWVETRVRMPEPGAAPGGTGQGRRLIEEALPYQLQAETSFVLARDGVRCSIALPLSGRGPAETAVELPGAA
ncbi:PAS domain S-box-containing protein [Sphingomonas endophytica]|uniref:histidine kinase n=1 Tax=Sphingomonas endophytica TaxID=869719 RepID=A0A7X0JDT9_9SPHN|nr:PAS domain S-box protein [Sphingomonas endophytica]MBB6505720.1 PAS domain S-box-containing protein [Sphingomonas endophytica]